MNDNLPSLPSLTELFKHGLVATSSVAVGLLFIFIGAFGELSLSNRKLLLGACLTCFGIMWHFGGQTTGVVDDEHHSMRYWNWNHVFTCVLFLLLFLVFGFAFVRGHFPFW